MNAARITVKIDGVKIKLFVSGEISEEYATKIFNEISSKLQMKDDNSDEGTIQSQNDLQLDSLETSNNKEKKIVRKKTKYERVLEYVEEYGPVDASEIVEDLGYKKTLVSSYLHKMKTEGKVKNTSGTNRLYVSTNPKQNNVRIFEQLMANIPCRYVMDYIFTKDAVNINSLREYIKDIGLEENVIPNVINPLLQYNLIEWNNDEDIYSIPLSSRIWYYPLMKDQGMTHKSLTKALKTTVESEEFKNALTEAFDKQLIRLNVYGDVEVALK